MQELVLKVGGLDAVQKPCLGASSQEHSVLTLKTARFH